LDLGSRWIAQTPLALAQFGRRRQDALDQHGQNDDTADEVARIASERQAELFQRNQHGLSICPGDPLDRRVQVLRWNTQLEEVSAEDGRVARLVDELGREELH